MVNFPITFNLLQDLLQYNYFEVDSQDSLHFSYLFSLGLKLYRLNSLTVSELLYHFFNIRSNLSRFTESNILFVSFWSLAIFETTEGLGHFFYFQYHHMQQTFLTYVLITKTKLWWVSQTSYIITKRNIFYFFKLLLASMLTVSL